MPRVEPRDVTIQIRVTASQKKRLTMKAKKEKDTVSNLVYPHVVALLKDEPSEALDIGFLDD